MFCTSSFAYTINNISNVFHLPDKTTLTPNVGPSFGGTNIYISGPCIEEGMTIICRFDNEHIVVGEVIDTVAVCISPMFGKIGPIVLEVSLDAGVTYASKATYTLGKIEYSMSGCHSHLVYFRISVLCVLFWQKSGHGRPKKMGEKFLRRGSRSLSLYQILSHTSSGYVCYLTTQQQANCYG